MRASKTRDGIPDSLPGSPRRTCNRIAVRFEYEYHNDSGQRYRVYGNENWEFDELGYMKFRYASINDLPIKESDRKFR